MPHGLVPGKLTKNALILYDQQDQGLWDAGLINQGMHFLDLSAQGHEVSSYHLEARIAYWHCMKEDTKEKWEGHFAIVQSSFCWLIILPALRLTGLMPYTRRMGKKPLWQRLKNYNWKTTIFISSCSVNFTKTLITIRQN